MERKDAVYVDRWRRKMFAMRELGNKCEDCGETNIFVLDFHHIDQSKKEFEINQAITRCFNLDKLLLEVKKCKLLCGNCHFLYTKIRQDTAIFKENLLEYKNTKSCKECGFCPKQLTSLVFHHIGDKNMKMSDIVSRSGINGCSDVNLSNIKKEIDKCDVLCVNCHRLIHSDIQRFNKYKEIIYSSSYLISKQKKVDRKRVLELRANGFSQLDIAKNLGCQQSCISKILKKENNS